EVVGLGLSQEAPPTRRRISGASDWRRLATSFLLQLVNLLRRLGLGEIVTDFLVRLFGESVHIGALCPGHRLLAGSPVFLILLFVGSNFFLGVAIDHCSLQFLNAA